MYRGTTPTVTLTLPEEYDLTGCKVFVSLSDKNYYKTVTLTDVRVSGNTVKFSLTQVESLGLPSKVLIQLNWLYSNGSRLCTKIVSFDTRKNLINEVLE